LFSGSEELSTYLSFRSLIHGNGESGFFQSSPLSFILILVVYFKLSANQTASLMKKV